jgi:competence/damage-inducible protein CinA-like protein
MDVILLTIGDEILKGRILNTNARFMAQRLFAAGFSVREVRCVGDSEVRIIESLEQCFSQAPLVIATGGLGPTRDDRTKKAACSFFNRELVLDEELLSELKKRFAAMGYSEFPERSVCQAEVPQGAQVLPNPWGTASGLLLEDANRALILLPGVPIELQGLMNEEVLPLLSDRFGRSRSESEIVRTIGLGESLLAERVEVPLGPEEKNLLSYYPHGGMVDVVISSESPDASDTNKLRRIADTVAASVSDYVYGRDERSFYEVVGELLRQRGYKVALAESCTGGLLAKKMTDVPGSSDYFECGVVSYSNEAKKILLGVPEKLIAEHGAVSEQVCRAMAKGLKKRTGADYTIAITGVAGPGGGTSEKPVGTVCIGLCSPAKTTVERISLTGDREQVRLRSSVKALELLWFNLTGKTV